MPSAPTDHCAGDPDPDIEVAARLWSGKQRPARYLFPAFWLIYLGQAVSGVAKHSHGAGAATGYCLIGAFAVSYLVALPVSRTFRQRLFWMLYALTIAITAATSVFAHEDALVMLIYVAVLSVSTRRQFALPLVVVLALTTAFLPKAVPSWHAAVQWDDGFSVLLVALAMWGFFNVVRANMALSAARAEVARLAAENERTRIARDLHDLLGHSLTTITVKAGLARRLAERGEAARALTEITEVEQLTRRTLSDVRAAVAGHREVTLAGELATSREVLRAAGVAAELPGSVDVVDGDLVELFGWVLREGVTNVVRHARAAHITVTFGPRSVEIVDDGRGGPAGAGNGLTGLRERVEAAGGTLAASGSSRGFRLRAEVPPPDVDRLPVTDAAGIIDDVAARTP